MAVSKYWSEIIATKVNRIERPAAGWEDADLTKDVFDGPCDHGFDYARFTSRSHGTSGPDAETTGTKSGKNKKGSRNTTTQSIGPGHIHNRRIIGATGQGKQLIQTGENAYDLLLHTMV